MKPAFVYLLVAIGCSTCCVTLSAEGEQQPNDKRYGINQREAWTTSQIFGSPEPPLPYATEPVFEKLKWDRPIYAKAEPGTDWLVVVQQGGETDKPSHLLRASHDADEPATLLQIENRLVYGIEFHPDYETNGFLYVFSNGPTPKPERKNRISRYTVSRTGDSATDRICSLDSEVTIIEWRSMGHDGGELAFGRDGMLYISAGDGTSDSDTWLSAQNLNSLNGSVLRIDVDHPPADAHYAIPEDNPFLNEPNARGEIWAFGLRNPWRLCADKQSGQVWVGNNGQDLWETAHLIRRGENYGWSVYEGSHPFYINRQRGPAPITPPTVEHHHIEARSLTGGVVYRGERFPELDGAYVYGDYATGKVWGVRHDGTRVTWHQELTDTAFQIAGFAKTKDGDLLIFDHGGGLHQLKKTDTTDEPTTFPRRLSETGLFTSVVDQQVQPGVIAYSVKAEAWNDGATAERFFAVPGDEQIGCSAKRGWMLPNGSAVIQTLSMPASNEGNNDDSTSIARRRIETRLLIRQQNEWVGYSYRWNVQQDDAMLVERLGDDLQLDWPNSDGTTSPRTWHIPSRAECMSCHSRAVGFVLGLSSPQIDRLQQFDHVTDNQLRTYAHIGLFKEDVPKEIHTLVDPYDDSNSLDARARSYLHVNCSTCHVEAGGGNARMELEIDRDLDAMRLIQARPQHATFGIADAHLVTPSEPDRSILFQRVSRRGLGQMPPLMSNAVDQQGVELMRDWISQMKKPEREFVAKWKLADFESVLNEVAPTQSISKQSDAKQAISHGKQHFAKLGCAQCHRFADSGGGAGPDLTTVATRLKPNDLLQSILDPSVRVDPQYASTILITVDGNTLEGRIEREDDETIAIRTTGALGEPIELSKEEVEERLSSTQSIMPSGMLDYSTKQQILDLLAYLSASNDNNLVANGESREESSVDRATSDEANTADE